jgi:hypothetical protein
LFLKQYKEGFLIRVKINPNKKINKILNVVKMENAKMEQRAAKKEDDDRFIRNDCTSRITKLEALLEQSSKEKDEMRQIILSLTAQVAELRTKVEYLTDNK